MHLKKHLQNALGPRKKKKKKKKKEEEEEEEEKRLGNNHKLNSRVFTTCERNQQSNTPTHTQIGAPILDVG